MTINVIQILLIVVFASLAYWVNERLNRVPELKGIVSVVIVVVAVVMLIASLFGGMAGLHTNIKVG